MAFQLYVEKSKYQSNRSILKYIKYKLALPDRALYSDLYAIMKYINKQIKTTEKALFGIIHLIKCVYKMGQIKERMRESRIICAT